LALLEKEWRSYPCRCGPICLTAWDGCREAFSRLCAIEAMALALFTILDEDEDEGIATISESTSFFQGIRKGRIKAVGRVIKKCHNVAFMEGMVTNSDDGSRLSETVASFVIMPKRRKE
jgi:hypothetical protein